MLEGDYLEQRMTDQDYWETLCRFADKHKLFMSFGYSKTSVGYVCDDAEDLKAAIRQQIYDERGE